MTVGPLCELRSLRCARNSQILVIAAVKDSMLVGQLEGGFGKGRSEADALLQGRGCCSIQPWGLSSCGQLQSGGMQRRRHTWVSALLWAFTHPSQVTAQGATQHAHSSSVDSSMLWPAENSSQCPCVVFNVWQGLNYT